MKPIIQTPDGKQWFVDRLYAYDVTGNPTTISCPWTQVTEFPEKPSDLKPGDYVTVIPPDQIRLHPETEGQRYPAGIHSPGQVIRWLPGNCPAYHWSWVRKVHAFRDSTGLLFFDGKPVGVRNAEPKGPLTEATFEPEVPEFKPGDKVRALPPTQWKCTKRLYDAFSLRPGDFNTEREYDHIEQAIRVYDSDCHLCRTAILVRPPEALELVPEYLPGKWYPIATAPKGTRILVKLESGGVYIDTLSPLRDAYTHWSPLPT